MPILAGSNLYWLNTVRLLYQTVVNGMCEKEGNVSMKGIALGNLTLSTRSIQAIFTMIAVIFIVTACTTDGSFRGSDYPASVTFLSTRLMKNTFMH